MGRYGGIKRMICKFWALEHLKNIIGHLENFGSFQVRWFWMNFIVGVDIRKSDVGLISGETDL